MPKPAAEPTSSAPSAQFAAPGAGAVAPGPTRRAALHRIGRIALQAGSLAALWAATDWAVRTLALPLPAGVLGLAVLLALLLSGRLAPHWVKDGANWLLTDMLLFFIPATVGAVQYGGLFRSDGWRLALVVIVGTVFVMGVVAIAVERAARLERRLALMRTRRRRAASVTGALR